MNIRDVRAAITTMMATVSAQNMVSIGAKMAEATLKENYQKKFYAEMKLKSAGYKYPGSPFAYRVGASAWQGLKVQHGFTGGVGIFTGTTQKAIGSKVTKEGLEHAEAKVWPRGRWPRVTGTDTNFGRGNKVFKLSTLSPQVDKLLQRGGADLHFGGGQYRELDEDEGTSFGSDEVGGFTESRTNTKLENLASDWLRKAGFDRAGRKAGDVPAGQRRGVKKDTASWIMVSSGKVVVKYNRDSPAKVIPSEDIAGKPKKYGPFNQGINFMYLDSGEIDTMIGGLGQIIFKAMNK